MTEKQVDKSTRQPPKFRGEAPDEPGGPDIMEKGTQAIIRDAILNGGLDKSTAIDVGKKLGASLLASLIYNRSREFIKTIPERIQSYRNNSKLIRVKLPDAETARWIVTFVHEQKDFGGEGHNQFEALVDRSVDWNEDPSERDSDQLRGKDLVKLIPSADSDAAAFTYEGNAYEIQREYPQTNQQSQLSRTRLKPEFYLKTWQADRSDMKKLIKDATLKAWERSQSVVKIHRMNNFGNWNSQGFSEGMKLDSLVLEQGQKDRVTADVESFLDDREFCRKHGTPWRRGYLLEGPHGTGKTSLVRALAHEYEMDLYEVNVCSASMDDGKLKHAMSQIGEGDIALIEDVDAVYDDNTDSSVTPRGFSVAIDGVAEQPGRVLFMTTNNSDMLEERITRSGRVDRTFRLGLATTDMARRLFLKFFPDQGDKARQFAEALGERVHSPAAIQGHFMQYRDPDQALARAHEIEKSTGDNNYA